MPARPRSSPVRRLVGLLSPLLLVTVGVVHLLPVTGMSGPEALRRLYGTNLTDPDVVVLMRHRAALFLCVGGLLIGAARWSEWRFPAILIGVVSVGSFLVIVGQSDEVGPELSRIAAVDRAALGALLTAAVIESGHRAGRAT
ncbi:phosphopantetheine adenylyltransferase [Euzebya tangerina]|uniref:phosphopantetheine adenylyltransferase n=1 Tax=Euzebya tangerina TaxID=591198 RepID=UPI000E320ECF|nr:phosphopantetheine adenylyltransferase [Euzebya tangerina]